MIDLNKVHVKTSLPTSLRETALLLQRRVYMSVGDFLQQVPNPHLAEFVLWTNSITLHVDTKEMMENIVILAEMLSQAEGAPMDMPDAVVISNLMILLTFEDLSRKAIIDFNHEKATLNGNLNEVQNLASLR